jgi:transposase
MPGVPGGKSGSSLPVYARRRAPIAQFGGIVLSHRGRASARALAAARDEFELRLLRLLVPERAVPAYRVLAEHLWKHVDEWLTFLSRPAVEATNWWAEQALRPAVNRKVWGGSRTAAGAQAQGILLSVLQTGKQQGHAALDFVSQTLRAFGNRLLARPSLLPTG